MSRIGGGSRIGSGNVVPEYDSDDSDDSGDEGHRVGGDPGVAPAVPSFATPTPPKVTTGSFTGSFVETKEFKGPKPGYAFKVRLASFCFSRQRIPHSPSINDHPHHVFSADRSKDPRVSVTTRRRRQRET